MTALNQRMADVLASAAHLQRKLNLILQDASEHLCRWPKRSSQESEGVVANPAKRRATPTAGSAVMAPEPPGPGTQATVVVNNDDDTQIPWTPSTT